MKKLSVVMPVYYNEHSLPPFFSEITKIETILRGKGMGLELIFVDDGSGDNSWGELQKIKKQREETRIIKLARNFGAVHASKTGLQFVTGDCFAVLAADLQDPPGLLSAMVDHWLAGRKFVICVRAARHDPLIVRICAALYYKLIRLMVARDFPTGGFDVYLMDSTLLPHMQRASKNVNPNLLAYWLGFTPEILHYTRQERIHGKSRWTLSKKLRFFLDSILGFSIVPIRAISCIGIVISLISFGYGTSVVLHALMGNRIVPGFVTIAALISFLLGLIIVMLGVIGEYLWRIFDEVNKKPESVIDEMY